MASQKPGQNWILVNMAHLMTLTGLNLLQKLPISDAMQKNLSSIASEIKKSDWLLQVMWLSVANQSASFHHRVATLL